MVKLSDRKALEHLDRLNCVRHELLRLVDVIDTLIADMATDKTARPKGDSWPERQNELQQRIDRRFDQFSLDELRDADSGALTFGLAFPDLSIGEREFAERYFNQKMDELRRNLQHD